jgi:hypothetical protein
VLHVLFGSVVQSHLQEDSLCKDHHHRLRQQGGGVVLSKPIEDPEAMLLSCSALVDSSECSYFKIDATSMIRGMSKEKPAELLFR